MKYMGSKNRHARDLLPIILEGRKPGQWYVEPFVGGANIIDKVPGKRIGADTHRYLISLWQAVSSGWEPPSDVSEAEYAWCKDEQSRASHLSANPMMPLIGFVGFGCSYSGKWFGGYARGNDTSGQPRNYAAESARNILRQAEALRGVEFRCSSYDALEIPPASIIYCDPPYAGTTKYASGAFDHVKFWQWCEAKVVEGHTVFVSEYTAPESWECVWSKQVNNTLTKDTGSKQGVERLFTRKA